jgi:hypothetical protein
MEGPIMAPDSRHGHGLARRTRVLRDQYAPQASCPARELPLRGGRCDVHFESRVFLLEGDHHLRFEHTNEDRRRFVKGTAVDVRYDPQNPSDAVIDGTIPWERGAMAGFGAFFFVAGMIGLVRILLH